jgi:hypothetical protein
LAYIGTIPAEAYTSFAVQHFTTSATDTFTLDFPVANENEIALFINNVRQEPGSGYAYTASGTTLTLASAITGSDSMYCVFIGKTVQTVAPAAGSVTDSMMSYPLTNFSSTSIDVTGKGTFSGAGSFEALELITSDTNRVYVTGNSSVSGDMWRIGTSASNPYLNIDGLQASSGILFRTGGTNERMRIDSSGNLGIGTSSPQQLLHLKSNNPGGKIRLEMGQTGVADTDVTGEIQFYHNDASGAGVNADIKGICTSSIGAGALTFGTGTTSTTERMRIGSSGNILIAKSSSTFGTAGVELNVGNAKYNQFTRSGGGIVDFNRLTNDGEILAFHQDSSKEGTISVSGATVAYNGFTGTHWSRLSDNSKPTILKGTILESLDEMMDWYQVQFDITETDDEGNETTITKKESYELGDGESVGDVITYTYEDTDYQATIIQEGDVKHTKSKISDTVDAKNVYGVFMAWDNDDDTVNDMYVAQTGTFVVRINGSETVSKGDLIQSNGDGTGKVQADDLLRASTVAKVLSTTKIETYGDGSYIVPCSLHC